MKKTETSKDRAKIKNEIRKKFFAWKNNLSSLPPKEAIFEEWLFIRIADLLLTDKPGTLLNLIYSKSLISIRARLDRINSLSKKWNFSYIRMHHSRSSIKIFFYHPKNAKRSLDLVPLSAMKKLGYTKPQSLYPFLEKIKKRWRDTGEVPHEIGLVCGYPVKDVLGFMNIIDLPYRGSCGWRIYKTLEPSLRKYEKYKIARILAKEFVNESPPK